MNIKRLIECWKLFRTLYNAQEYFVVTTYQEDNVEPWRGPTKYEYISNTNRELFYKFVKDYIDILKKS